MRGFPLLQVLAIIGLFALAGLPVWKLTRPPAAPVAVRAQTGDDAGEVSELVTPVELHFAPAPKDFQLTSLGKPVLTGQGPGVDFSGHWIHRGDLPQEGADLALQVDWPEATNAGNRGNVAVRVIVNGQQADQTFWGEAGTTMVEIVTVKPSAATSRP